LEEAVAAAVEVEEEEVMEGEDQFGSTSINIDIFLSQFNKPDGLPDYSLPPIFLSSSSVLIAPSDACILFS